MTIFELLEKINTRPEQVEFTEVINTIDSCYRYNPTGFRNGKGSDTVINEAGTNEGSCKIFAFAKLNNLDNKQTLTCFGRYYREDVLGHPDGDNHANIRSFMRHGWQGIAFDNEALQPR